MVWPLVKYIAYLCLSIKECFLLRFLAWKVGLNGDGRGAMDCLDRDINQNTSIHSFATTVFNLEISQSGSYVPHGILNWVISNMVYLDQTMILKL